MKKVLLGLILAFTALHAAASDLQPQKFKSTIKMPGAGKLAKEILYCGYIPVFYGIYFGGVSGLLGSYAFNKGKDTGQWICAGAQVGGCVGLLPASYSVYRQVYQPYKVRAQARAIIKDKTLEDILRDDDVKALEAWLWVYPQDVHECNAIGENLLHRAVDNDARRLTMLLLRQGCDVRAQDADHLTPLERAERLNKKEIAQTIRLFQEVEKKYIDEFKAEELQLKNEFAAAFGLKLDELMRYVTAYDQQWYDHYETREIESAQKRCKQSLSPELASTIHEILKKNNIKREIKLVADHSEEGSDIVAMKNCLIIDEQRFKELYLTQDQVEAVLWHEITHMVHKDDECLRALTVLRESIFDAEIGDDVSWMPKISQEKFNQQEWDRLRKQFMHFREKRADILSCLRGKRLCEAWIVAHQRFIAIRIERNDDAHPSAQVRLAYSQKILKEMQNFQHELIDLEQNCETSPITPHDSYQLFAASNTERMHARNCTTAHGTRFISKNNQPDAQGNNWKPLMLRWGTLRKEDSENGAFKGVHDGDAHMRKIYGARHLIPYAIPVL